MRLNILITGSEGIVGGVIKKALSEHNLTLLDKELDVDLLKEGISSFFYGTDLVIHLAANPQPWIDLRKAKENLSMMWNVLDSCRTNNINRIIFSSSICVYDFQKLYEEGKRITDKTPVSPNLEKWAGGENVGMYSISKIMCENLLKQYEKGFGIKYLTLRLGRVSPDNRPSQNHPLDSSTWLSHEDLTGIIQKAVNFKNSATVICASNNSDQFIDLSSLKKVLGYFPISNSDDYRI